MDRVIQTLSGFYTESMAISGVCMLVKYDELRGFTMICHKYMEYTLKEVNLGYP